MQDIVTTQEVANIDLSKVAALQQKRTLAFVNHFVITTVQFLNTFSKKCEKKLMLFEQKLEKINAAMVLLEARLSSIPEVNDLSQTEGINVDNSETTEIKSDEKQNENVSESTYDNAEHKNQESENSNPNDRAKLKQEYERFVKMIHVGVPLDAVKLKISLEGLDPNVLDDILKK